MSELNVGYINDEERHCMISVKRPAMSNPRSPFVQVVLKIEDARRLCDLLEEFLEAHDAKPPLGEPNGG